MGFFTVTDPPLCTDVAAAANNSNSDELTINGQKRKIKELEAALASEKKKIKLLQQKNRRYKKKISNLFNHLLHDLKNQSLLTDDSMQILDSASSINRECISRQILKATKSHLDNKFSPELRAFALTLHFYSPRAYDYVRNFFNLTLPHPRTISKWYQHIDGNPGFTQEAIKSIQQKITYFKHQILFGLSFDEMCIRRHVEYDGSQFHG